MFKIISSKTLKNHNEQLNDYVRDIHVMYHGIQDLTSMLSELRSYNDFQVLWAIPVKLEVLCSAVWLSEKWIRATRMGSTTMLTVRDFLPSKPRIFNESVFFDSSFATTREPVDILKLTLWEKVLTIRLENILSQKVKFIPPSDDSKLYENVYMYSINWHSLPVKIDMVGKEFHIKYSGSVCDMPRNEYNAFMEENASNTEKFLERYGKEDAKSTLFFSLFGAENIKKHLITYNCWDIITEYSDIWIHLECSLIVKLEND